MKAPQFLGVLEEVAPPSSAWLLLGATRRLVATSKPDVLLPQRGEGRPGRMAP